MIAPCFSHLSDLVLLEPDESRLVPVVRSRDPESAHGTYVASNEEASQMVKIKGKHRINQPVS